jgi:hypothetical protein
MRDWCRPEQGTRCFDQLPATVERLLTGASHGPVLGEPLLRERFERVVFVYFDAFGWTFLERHADHPLLARAHTEGLLAQLTAQFPSTTTAQVTTIHSGLPVAEHGLYEWHVYEPTLDRLITPLLFSFAGDGIRGTLLGQIEPDGLFPSDSIYARLADAGVRSTVVLPTSIAGSAPNVGLLRKADVVPFDTAQSALAAASRALDEGAGYAHVYLDSLDSLMHGVGTDDDAVGIAIARGCRIALEHADATTAAGEPDRRGQPREPAAHDSDVGSDRPPCHERMMRPGSERNKDSGRDRKGDRFSA